MAAAVAATLFGPAVHAANDADDPAPLPEEHARALTGALSDLVELERAARQLAARVAASEGADLDLVERRLAHVRERIVEDTLALAADVAQHTEEGLDVEPYREPVARRLKILPRALLEREEALTQELVFTSDSPKPAERAAADRAVKRAIRDLTNLYELRLETLELSARFGIDSARWEKILKRDLAERAASVSFLLEMALDDAAAVREQLDLLPGDSDVEATARIADARAETLTSALEQFVDLMRSLGLDTHEYDQQLVAATGELSTNLLDLRVVGDVVSGWGVTVSSAVIDEGPGLVFQVFLFVVIVLAFYQVARVAKRIVERSVNHSKVKLSGLLKRMIISGTRNLILLAGLLIALSQLGISLGPVLAGLGIAGFIIGFALQDSLSNFASGLMILLYRPIDVGDLVEAGGVFGNVSHMNLVNTTILTLDNQTLIVPNNMIWTNVIKNVTAQGTRRVDLLFGISYSDEIPKAERILTDIIESHPLVLKDPEPRVRLHELGDSSVNFAVRPWVRAEDYWDVYWDVTRAVKIRFDEEGVTIPFPQRDVHLHTVTSSDAPSDGQESLGSATKGP